jgi:SAM-dependent methyltransferase
MLEVARSLAAKGPVQCEWFDGSALAMPFAAATFDIVFCQLGLQFFPNRPSALAEMRRVLVPGGRLALSVYSAIERTPAAHAFADALDAHFGAGASSTKRSEHALSDRRELQRLAQGAGFVDIRIEIVTQEIRFPSCREYVRFQLLATPMAALLSHMGDAERQGVIEALAGRVGAALAAHIRDGQLIFPQEAHVLLARR